MGRRRKEEDQWMPQRVYRGKSAFEFRPYDGGCYRLCPLSASQRTVLDKFNELSKKLETVSGSFEALANDYLASPKFNKLSPRTKKDYRKYSEVVIPVFGRMACNVIKPIHIRQYMDKRGKVAEVQANREHSFMRVVFSWGFERGRVNINPCKGVKQFPETSRKRYITHEEYEAVLEFAHPLLKAAMEISYCCGSRQGDVLNLSHKQLLDEGIYIKQGKTSKEQIKEWTPRLRDAIKTAQEYSGVRSMKWVLSNKKGGKTSGNSLRDWYTKAKNAAAKKYETLNFDFTFHDIKHKSITDIEGDKQLFSGHLTKEMAARYNHSIEISKSHDYGSNKGRPDIPK